jgi:CRISPR-associated endonuclease Csn1
MKTILGLDIGTNSIGGALIKLDTENFGQKGSILWTGSRIVPVDGDALQKFESGGQVETKAANRRQKRGSRRLKHRYKLRRTRLIKTLQILGWIPDNFPTDFKQKKKDGIEFKMKDYLPFSETTVQEAAKAFQIEPNKKGEINVPEDWIVYFLRKKALSEKIELSEFARILYVLNQRRGFKSSRKDLQDETNVMPYDEFDRMTKSGKYTDADGKILETQFVETTKVVSVIQTDDEKDKKGNFTFEITAESPRMKIWHEKRKKKPEWKGEEFRFLVTLRTDKKKNDITQPKKPVIPTDNDWGLAMVSLDNELEHSGKKVGEFFLDKLVKDKNYRIRQQVVKRNRYELELKAIWEKQSEFHPELKSKDKLEEIARMLYPLQSENKLAKWTEITNNSLFDVISKDIIYYQRDLKSQKNLIDECRYEKKPTYTNKKGEQITPGYKAAPKSCPEFQEFRIWQDIHNLRVLLKEDEETGKEDIPLADDLFSAEVKAKLFDLFNRQEEVTQQQILKIVDASFANKTHKINLFANRDKLKGNETKALFRKVFKKYDYEEEGEELLNNKDNFQLLWHIMYSITGKGHEEGIRKGLTNPKNGFGNLPEDVVTHLAEKTKEFPGQYAAYSRKAIKKLLPLMRCGKYWNSDAVIAAVSSFLEWKETDAFLNLGLKIQNQLKPFEALEDFEGLETSMSCYVVYGRHSERESDFKYKTWEEIDPMKIIPTNSLRNPIVEQVVRETMQVVKEIWKQYGRPDEIHIEMGRDLKKNAKERKRTAEGQRDNYNEKQRVKKLLQELNEGNPNSPIDIEKFRMWKGNGGWEADVEFNKLFDKSNAFVKEADIQKYRLWAEQKHRSPYTGEQIMLSDLFTKNYEKEHIIPRSKLKNDGMANLVICEAAVNDFKDNRLAQVMINEDGGRTHTHKGVTFELLSKDKYLQNCKSFDKWKRKNLLAEEVPEGFIERQLNDTRHITRKLNELLYPVAKDKEGLVFTIGSITNDLKQQWGINTVWKDLIKYRFERLGKILEQELIEEDGNKYHFNKPDDKVDLKRIDHRHHAMDALVIAATTRAHINYLNALNSHKEREKWKYVAKEKVRNFHLPWPDFAKDAKDKLSEVIISHKYNNRVLSKPHNRYWKWEQQADGSWKKVLKKQKDNPLWKAVKKAMFSENPLGAIYVKDTKPVKVKDAVKIQIEREKGIKDQNGKPRDYIYDKDARPQIKQLVEQFNSDIQAIDKHLKKHPLTRKNGQPMDKIWIACFTETFASRVALNDSFTEKKILTIPNAERTIKRWEKWQKEGVIKRNGKEEKFPTDTKKWPLPFLLIQHLNEKDEDGNKKYDGPKEAFKGEGLEDLFRKAGRTIKKVTTYETKSNPIRLGKQVFETGTGGNVYFVIQENEETKDRNYYSVPLFSTDDVKGTEQYGTINRLLHNEPIADEKAGHQNIILKVGDLVYVSTPDEIEHYKENNINWVDDINWNGKDRKRVFERIYKMVSCGKTTCEFVPHNIATPILPYDRKSKTKGEIGWNNKSEITFDGETTIKDVCIPIEVDRLGNIVKVDGRDLTNSKN